jgi:hypothetical protein
LTAFPKQHEPKGKKSLSNGDKLIQSERIEQVIICGRQLEQWISLKYPEANIEAELFHATHWQIQGCTIAASVFWKY